LSHEEKCCLKHAKELKRNVLFCEENRTLYIILPSTEASFDLKSTMQAMVETCNRLQLKNLVIIKENGNKELIKGIKGIQEKLKRENIIVSIAQGVTRVEDEKTRKIILNDYHMLPTGGHAGCTRMYKNIRKTYFWPKLSTDVENFVKKCDSCQRYKYSINKKEPMIVTTTNTVALNKIFLDLIGPFPPNDMDDFVYALTMQCELTKYLIIAPIINKEAATVARAFVEQFILVYGIPECIASDCGTEFLAEIFKQTAKILHVKQIQSTSYHHESIGSLENTHKHAAAFLRAQIAKYGGSWASWCFAFNTTEHTQTGYTPHELVFGKVCEKPTSIFKKKQEPLYNPDDYRLELIYQLNKAWEEAHENLIRSKIKRIANYDISSKPKEFLVGDKVLLKKENRKGKLDEIYIGPFEILEVENPNVKIKIKNRRQLVHKNRLKQYIFYLE
jgi:hypothetical protein